MVVSTIYGIIHEKNKHDTQLGNIPTINPVNQGVTASLIDTDTFQYAPRATMQFDVETYGSQNSPVADQDIVIVGGFNGNKFYNLDNNNILNSGGVAVINPTVNSKVSNNLLYQGFDVMDGEIQ